MAPKRGDSNFLSLTPAQVNTYLCTAISRTIGTYRLIDFFNTHLSQQQRDRLFSAAMNGQIGKDDWPGNLPVFHSYRPSKQTGFYAQVGKTDPDGPFYIHQVAALQNTFWKQPTATDGHMAVQLLSISNPEASHIVTGYGTAARDINPRNLVLESGLVNRSRITCSLALAGYLKKLFRISQEAAELSFTPVEPEPEAEEAEEAEGGLVAASMAFTSEMLLEQPQVFEQAVKTVTSGCNLLSVHEPCCLFWDWGKSAPPAVSAWVGDSRKLDTAVARNAALASISEAVENSLATYADSVFTPPTAKALKSAAGQTARTARDVGSVQPQQLNMG